ncbi:hypothetical protein [Profundibacter sp.]
MSSDPLLTPFQLKHLTLKNRIMTTSHEALTNGEPQTIVRNAGSTFQRFCIGDTVSARNTHAAIYDALRLVKDI